MKKTNVILAGLPRSGTTLTCHLLNKIPNVVALHEPMNPFELAGLSAEEVLANIKAFFEAQRKSLLEAGTAKSKSVDGAVPSNSIGGFDPETGKRICVLNSDVFKVDKPLDKDFLLAIKDPNFCAANLPLLTADFECFAVVRNPLSVLLSWNTVEMPCSEGYAPAAEAFDKKLSTELRSEPDKYTRQLRLLSWHFEQYVTNLSPERIIRYEETIASGGRALQVIHPGAAMLNEPLRSKNDNAFYDSALKAMLAEKLLQLKNGLFWQFYTPDQITALLD